MVLVYHVRMPRRSKYDFEAMRASMNVECPHCHAVLLLLSTSDWIRIDCAVRSAGRIYTVAERPPADANELKRQLRAILLTRRFHSRVA
jgi:hypothetical protein